MSRHVVARGRKPAGWSRIAWSFALEPCEVTPTRERYFCGCEWFEDDTLAGLWEPCERHREVPLTEETHREDA